MARKMPAQRPGDSEQSVGTPPEFLRAVEARFGRICWDLAADAGNRVVRYYLGPGSNYGEDALRPGMPWANLWSPGGLLWLNPPFGQIAAFSEKANQTGQEGARLAMLTPASVGTNWFVDHVVGRAHIYFLRPRLVFVGHESGYPKDLILSVWNPPRLQDGRVPPLINWWNLTTDEVWSP